MAVPPRRRRHQVTLTEIAIALDLAPSTVSRAMSNPGRVNPATYDRIVRKAQDMGYQSALLPGRRDQLARGTVALLVPNLTNPFNLDILRGSQAQTQAAGYLHLVVNSEESVQVETDWLAELSRTVDAVVLSTPRADDDVLRSFADTLPIAVLNREVEGLCGIVTETPAGLSQGLDYLVSLGHRRIAYVRGPIGSWTDRARYDALRAAAQRQDVELIVVGSFQPSLAAGAAAADAVGMTAATAAIFFNDTLAIGALGRLRANGVRVPEDLSVIGCDDMYGASFTNPPLTTVTSPGERAGRAVTDLAIGRIGSKDRTRRVDRLASHLTVRDSTGPAPAQ